MPLKRPSGIPRRGKNQREYKLDGNATQDRLDAIAKRVTFVASPYHIRRSHKADTRRRGYNSASICEVDWSDGEKTGCLRSGIRLGNVSEAPAGEFPKHVWYPDPKTGRIFQATCTNRQTGEYHGYPLDEHEEGPNGIRWPAK